MCVANQFGPPFYTFWGDTWLIPACEKLQYELSCFASLIYENIIMVICSTLKLLFFVLFVYKEKEASQDLMEFY